MIEVEGTASRLLLAPSVIEGIGEVHAASLREMGITCLGDLMRARAARVARTLPRAGLATVEAWQAAAQLMQVDGVTPNVAEALVAARIHSVAELADVGLRTLEKALAQALAARRMHEDLSVYALAEIQRNAARLVPTGIVLAELLATETNAPIAGITVRCGSKKATTDDDGRFAFDALPIGSQRLEFDLGQGRVCGSQVAIRSRRVAGLTRLRVPTTVGVPRKGFREGPGKPILFAAGCRLDWVERALDDLPDPTELVVRKLYESGEAKLVHLYRSKIGRKIEVDTVRMAQADLPAGAKPGAVLELRSGKLSLTSRTVKDVQKTKVEGVLRGTFAEGARRLRRNPRI